MFSIKITSAFYLKNINIVAVDGDVVGELENGAVLYDRDNSENSYKSKGIFFVDGPNVKLSSKKLNIQLEPGSYQAEDLIGKTLVSK